MKEKAPFRNAKGPYFSSKSAVGFYLTLSLAFLLGMLLVAKGGVLIFSLLILSILLSIFYTAGPFPLGYLGLGEIFVFLCFGLLLLQELIIYKLYKSVSSLVAGFVPGFLSIVGLVVSNLRNIEEDRTAKKNTLAVRFGRSFAQIEYLCLLSSAMTVLIYMMIKGYSSLWILSTLMILPSYLFLLLSICFEKKPDKLNSVLLKTAFLLFPYTICFSLEILL